MNKLVAIGLVILVLLIALSMFLNSLLGNREAQPQQAVTPIPTPFVDSSRQPSEPQGANDFQITTDERERINTFATTLPYSSPNFDVAYSPELDQFFIQTKTPTARQDFEALLSQNNMTDLFNTRPALFVFSNDPPGTAIQKTDDAYKRARTTFQDDVAQASADAKEEEDQMQPLADLFDKMMNLKFETAGPSGSNCTTGGYPFGTRDQSLIGRPYQGTHTLGNWQSDNAVDLGTPIGTPVCAIDAGVIGRVKMNDPNPSSRYAGISVYLAVNGREWWYTHLSSIAPGIAPGTPVVAGQIIGYSGAANGVPHLHLGVNSGNPVALLGL